MVITIQTQCNFKKVIYGTIKSYYVHTYLLDIPNAYLQTHQSTICIDWYYYQT